MTGLSTTWPQSLSEHGSCRMYLNLYRFRLDDFALNVVAHLRTRSKSFSTVDDFVGGGGKTSWKAAIVKSGKNCSGVKSVIKRIQAWLLKAVLSKMKDFLKNLEGCDRSWQQKKKKIPCDIKWRTLSHSKWAWIKHIETECLITRKTVMVELLIHNGRGWGHLVELSAKWKEGKRMSFPHCLQQ